MVLDKWELCQRWFFAKCPLYVGLMLGWKWNFWQQMVGCSWRGWCSIDVCLILNENLSKENHLVVIVIVWLLLSDCDENLGKEIHLVVGKPSFCYCVLHIIFVSCFTLNTATGLLLLLLFSCWRRCRQVGLWTAASPQKRRCYHQVSCAIECWISKINSSQQKICLKLSRVLILLFPSLQFLNNWHTKQCMCVFR